MLDPWFKLVTSLVILAVMPFVILPAATDEIGRHGTVMMLVTFGGFFGWQAIAAIRYLWRRKDD